jgi:hypothetical protein
MANQARRPRWRNSTPDIAAIYDWLLANGVDEMLPERPTITIDEAAGAITYTAFVWDGPRGWDANNWRLTPANDGAHDVVTEMRTVPLRVTPDGRVADLFRAGSGTTAFDPTSTRADG